MALYLGLDIGTQGEWWLDAHCSWMHIAQSMHLILLACVWGTIWTDLPGAKALVYDADTKAVVARGARAYGIIATNVPGRAEQAPATWIEVGMLQNKRL